jgi:hypothetical protein
MTYQINLWLTTERARANRTLLVTDGGDWELQDSFELVVLDGYHRPGHSVSLSVTGTAFFPYRAHQRRDEVMFVLDNFLVAGGARPILRSSVGRFLSSSARSRLRVANHDFRWEIVRSW